MTWKGRWWNNVIIQKKARSVRQKIWCHHRHPSVSFFRRWKFILCIKYYVARRENIEVWIPFISRCSVTHFHEGSLGYFIRTCIPIETGQKRKRGEIISVLMLALLSPLSLTRDFFHSEDHMLIKINTYGTHMCRQCVYGWFRKFRRDHDHGIRINLYEHSHLMSDKSLTFF